MRASIFAAVLLVAAGTSSASAACYYDGVYYEAGYQICFDGWIQECTVADYWKAVGQCHTNDRTGLHLVDAGTLRDRLRALSEEQTVQR